MNWSLWLTNEPYQPAKIDHPNPTDQTHLIQPHTTMGHSGGYDGNFEVAIVRGHVSYGIDKYTYKLVRTITYIRGQNSHTHGYVQKKCATT